MFLLEGANNVLDPQLLCLPPLACHASHPQLVCLPSLNYRASPLKYNASPTSSMMPPTLNYYATYQQVWCHSTPTTLELEPPFSSTWQSCHICPAFTCLFASSKDTYSLRHSEYRFQLKFIYIFKYWYRFIYIFCNPFLHVCITFFV